MSAVKNGTRKHSVIVCAFIFALLCFFVTTLISLGVKVSAQKRVNAELMSQYNLQLDENADLEAYIGNSGVAEYIERIAREQYGYAKPEERVYFDSEVS